MGRNLMLNMADHGFTAAGYDKDETKVEALCKYSAEHNIYVMANLSYFIARLRKPRTVMLLVPAGAPVDSVINDLHAHLRPGDIIIDGGNTYFKDTNLRAHNLAAKGIHFHGSGGAAASSLPRY